MRRLVRMRRALALLVLLATSLGHAQLLPLDEAAITGQISAASLSGHVSFLASDLLEGRRTYTRGLDLAGEYIASRFRAAKLSPLPDGSYFQEAKTVSADGTELASRNVIGILHGSNRALAETYVIVSAHYDHMGVREDREGDNIWNGANDDASGVAGMIEIAEAFSRTGVRPKRSILFVAFYGEEMGLVGSRFFGKNPPVPLTQIIAHVNLEQIGRTDDTEAPRVGKLAMTGFDYSEVGAWMYEAGQKVGVAVEKHPQYSDAFFSRSDNQALADLGIPAHTVCTAFEFPDYHKATDHWDKLDYENMEMVVRAVALGVYMIGNSAEEPKWSETNPRAAKYLAAWRKLKS